MRGDFVNCHSRRGGLNYCHFNSDAILKAFELPQELVPVNILAIGYTDAEKPSSNRFDEQRKKISQLVYYNHL